MDVKELSKRLKFSVLAASMQTIGLDPEEVDGKTDAIRAIYDRFKEEGHELEYCCPICKADIPDLDACPFCGVSFTEEAGARTYVGARKGRRVRNFQGPTGPILLRKLIQAFKIPRNQVKWRKSVVSLWFSDGMICRCFVGTYSVRVQLPFASENYGDMSNVVLDYGRPVKNMVSRVYLEGEEDIGNALKILKLTVKLKAADRPNRTVGRPRKPIKPKEDTAEPTRRRNRPIQV